MAPLRVEEYLAELFCGISSNITMQVISDQDTLLQEYPLFACVNRAASVIPRHAGRIIFLTYEPPACVLETIMLVGKGVTYDTGGADIKCQGIMAGMSRDKCGAAACAGFMQVPHNISSSVAQYIMPETIALHFASINCALISSLSNCASWNILETIIAVLTLTA